MKSLLLSVGLVVLLSGIAIIFPLFKTSIELSLASKSGVVYTVSDPQADAEVPPDTTRTEEIQIPDSDFWLAIPRLGITVAVEKNIDFENNEAQKLAFSQKKLIHSSTSSLPGDTGTAVLASHLLKHTNWPSQNPRFYFLNRLSPGDQLVVGFENKRFVYQIASINKIENYPDIETGTEEQKLTLIASSPFINGPKIQVNADLVSN